MKLKITMGQGFRGRLEAALLDLGAGHTMSGGYADGSTSWVVLACFRKGTRRAAVQAALFEKFPAAWVKVERV